VGVFGVFSYLVEERHREIAIRIALGATRSQIGGALFHATKWPVAAGVIGGFLLSALVGVGLREFLFGLSAADPISYLAVTAALGVSAIVATAIPIRRAVRVDPAVALKDD
jgi:ABC-type antimicrobial peptide transport system permease subunit